MRTMRAVDMGGMIVGAARRAMVDDGQSLVINLSKDERIRRLEEQNDVLRKIAILACAAIVMACVATLVFAFRGVGG